MVVVEADGEMLVLDEMEEEEEVDDNELLEEEALAVFSEAVELVDDPESNLRRLLGGLMEVLLPSVDKLMSEIPVLGLAGGVVGSFCAGGDLV